MSEDKNIDLVGCMFGLFWLPILLVASCIYSGWVLAKLWAWFIVPTFNAPFLSIPVAIGISLIIGFTAKNHNVKTEETEGIWEAIVSSTLRAALIPSASLLTGYIVTFFM